MPNETADVCGAWLEARTGQISRRECVLRPNHSPGIRSDHVWHTDCPTEVESAVPLPTGIGHDHNSCQTWNDGEQGAHPSAWLAPAVPAQSVSGDTLPSYRAEIKFVSTPPYANEAVIVQATLYGPADFLATAVAALSDAFRDEVQQ